MEALEDPQARSSVYEYDIEEYPQSLETEMLLPPGDHSEDEDPDIHTTDTHDVSLYEGSSLIVPSSSILIMKYMIQHNLTKEALADLLQLIKLHCPSQNQCLSLTYQFKKQFSDFQYSIIVHNFCSSACMKLQIFQSLAYAAIHAVTDLSFPPSLKYLWTLG